MKLKHEIKIYPGHDCIRFECINDKSDCKPGSGGSHGIHGANLLFVSIGDKGAVQFALYTGWLPQSVNDGYINDWSKSGPLPADLGYHSKKPQYEGQTSIDDECQYCDGKPCYYDGSGLNAKDAMLALVNGGDEALWKFLDAYYACVFHGDDYPKPAEYKKPLRTQFGGDA